jgi:hypothetical protein
MKGFFETSFTQSENAQQTIAENRVVIFSKSYCPYCKGAKDLFATRFPDVDVKVLECVMRRVILPTAVA